MAYEWKQHLPIPGRSDNIGYWLSQNPTWSASALVESVGSNHFETLDSAEGQQRPGEDLTVNCGQFWSMSALSRVAAAHPPPQLHGRAVYVPGAVCTQTVVFHMDKTHPVLQISGIGLWSLIAASDHRGAKKSQTFLLQYPPTLLQAPTLPVWLLEHLKGQFPLSSLPPNSSFFFFLFVTQTLKTRTLKNNCIYGGK